MTSATAENPTSRSAEQLGFVPVAIDTLTSAEELPFDLFLPIGASEPPVLYRERSLSIQQEDLSRLVEQAIQTLYVRASEHVAYRNYLRETVLADADLPATRRFKILQIANRAILQMAFKQPHPDMLVNVASEYGRELATVICCDDLVMTDLLPLMMHDYQNYTHATNVCTLSLMIAASMEMSFADGIVEMATAMLLHDLGNRRIAPAVLNQIRPHTAEQREMLRNHPKWGFQDLCRRQEVSFDQLMVVYQHHEQWDGRGYPVGLVGEEIHRWARICAVADVYDKMASARPHQPAKESREIWEALELGCGKRFDREIVDCLKSVAGPLK